MYATPQNILEAFNQLPEIEKHAIASEIKKQVALLNFSPITDETLTKIAVHCLLNITKGRRRMPKQIRTESNKRR